MAISVGYIREYILSKWSEFSIENLKTGNKFHYQVQRASDKEGMYFVRIQTGLGEKYAGFIVEEEGALKYIKGQKGLKSEEDIEIKALMYVLGSPGTIADSVIVEGNGRCSECGKYIDKTDIESYRQGKCKGHKRK